MKTYDFGNGMVLEVGENGFTFKNTITGILIIDASTIKKGGEIAVEYKQLGEYNELDDEGFPKSQKN